MLEYKLLIKGINPRSSPGLVLSSQARTHPRQSLGVLDPIFPALRSDIQEALLLVYRSLRLEINFAFYLIK